ncbi:MAG: hypothetical protein LC798_07555 [Chloroflexi bacterium]|nr:hypothetical protein [Chloroflexota bacterium]
MRSSLSPRWRAVAGIVALGLASAVFSVPAPITASHDLGHEAEHALHNPPGNPIAYPVAEKIRRVGGDNTPTGGHVTVEGNRLYVGAYGLGFRMFDISDPEKPQLIGQYLPGKRADAVPDAAVFDGRHIAVLNGTNRLSVSTSDGTNPNTNKTEFLDVADPATPRLLWEFNGPTHGEAHNGDIVDERRLWLPSGGSGTNGLRIYDLRPILGSPAAAPTSLLASGTVNGRNPVELWAASPYRGNRPVGAAFTHTHDVSVYVDHPVQQPDGSVARRDIALLAEGGAYANNAGDTGSMFIIDVTDPRNPVVLNRWLHTRGEGHHPIRYHHEAQFLDGDPSVILVTDEDLHNGCGDAGGVTAIRVGPSLTGEPQELSEWFIPGDTPAPVCSVHVFSSNGSLVFFGSYNAGLQVVDYSDPANPVQAAYYIAPATTAWGALYHEGYIYVGDMSRGLDVYELDDPELLLKLKVKPKKLLP